MIPRFLGGSEEMSRLRTSPWRNAVVFLVIGLIVFPLVLFLSMKKGLSHDEHQHVAAGVLLAREGLLPYLDYPHFHTPNLAFVYALVFRFTDHLLLGARLVSVVCVTVLLAVLGGTIFQLFRRRGLGLLPSSAICAGAILLTLSTDLFTHTTGRAWNQEPAMLFVMLAFLAHVSAVSRASGRWLFLSGLLLGLAIGFRLTFAPLAAPFAVAFFYNRELRKKWKKMSAFAAGLAVSLAGIATLMWSAPEKTWFGNFGFAEANIVYRFSTGEPRTMTILKKLRFLFKDVITDDIGLMVAFAAPLICLALACRISRERFPLSLRFLLLLLPFLLIGSMAPSPVYLQYFYPLAFFLVLGGGYALAELVDVSKYFRSSAIFATAAVALSVTLGSNPYRKIDNLFTVGKWIPMQVHAEGQELRQHVVSGEVLTLAPIYALEGGYFIYPSFSTGPFAWRVSPYVEAAKAVRLKMTTPSTLETLLDADPPEGILIGDEKRGEDSLRDYAVRHNYRLVPRNDDDDLWIKK